VVIVVAHLSLFQAYSSAKNLLLLWSKNLRIISHLVANPDTMSRVRSAWHASDVTGMSCSRGVLLLPSMQELPWKGCMSPEPDKAAVAGKQGKDLLLLLLLLEQSVGVTTSRTYKSSTRN